MDPPEVDSCRSHRDPGRRGFRCWSPNFVSLYLGALIYCELAAGGNVVAREYTGNWRPVARGQREENPGCRRTFPQCSAHLNSQLNWVKHPFFPSPIS
jgi:hypothetical protein